VWTRGAQRINVHMRAWSPDVLASVDLVPCDDRRPVIDPRNGLVDLYPGLMPDIELGRVLVGAEVGRDSAEQTLMSFNYGLAIFDILVADYVRTRV
jgi:ornithine cyclodeaminase/alanine dehydrogenase-like protein (mu-crystallin family)